MSIDIAFQLMMILSFAILTNLATEFLSLLLDEKSKKYRDSFKAIVKPLKVIPKTLSYYAFGLFIVVLLATVGICNRAFNTLYNNRATLYDSIRCY